MDGIYTMANDRMASFLESFVRSLRRVMPSVPIGVIPFDDSVQKTEQLAATYGASLVPPDLTWDLIGKNIYGDEDYLKKLEEHGVRRSMSRKRNPWDNAVIESFFSTLRFELLGRTRFADPDEAERGIGEWIERFYNLHRRNTTLGNVSPINYELAWQMRKQRT